jgi:hypothetical protein
LFDAPSIVNARSLFDTPLIATFEGVLLVNVCVWLFVERFVTPGPSCASMRALL